MKIIEQSPLLEKKFTCAVCKTVFKLERDDLGKIERNGHTDIGFIKCPLCGHSCNVFAKE